MIRDLLEHELSTVAEALVRVQSMHADAYPSIYRRFTRDDAISHLTKSFGNPNVTIRVACEADEVVGHYLLAIEATPESTFTYAQRFGHLHQVDVEPRFRRRGIGTLLVDDAKSVASRLGLSRIVLDVWAFNDAALAFFDSAGFSAFGSKLLHQLPTDTESG